MKKSVLVGTVLSAFVFMLLLSTESYAQKELTGAKVEKSRGAARAMPDDSKPEAKPEKSRGSGPGTCCLSFSNYTGYYVDIWVDNVYRGRLNPWDDGDVCVGNGFTSWYAESSGGTVFWSDASNCNGNKVWNLKY